ncbi:hypothetical protein IU500_34360 [Nocardia terpenica]|uniref:hypothetical protein n=1 Tax=Nocardia terpenica TaxID=455432 RepID=UPI001892D922|nr:hypothetical protein [Nocardia terpenica]MBF6065418.1 hypothetical protein [Nocardia terpenica]MBF6109100.1 hypothetical protein [Nocardia terpenica]MBF6114698.1 hypothetical protein [Nocardia terpenica]MBF6123383.1 hypothetical protein [Nocardia terpenica]MBF6156599.1 hypothetical protein [Nocardia terpenica]
MTQQLPSQAEIFIRALDSLDTARNSLSDARDWLNSDWAPIGSALPDAAGTARSEARAGIATTKAQIDHIKSRMYDALRAIEASAGGDLA